MKGVIMPDLPDDVTQEILLRLPAMSLVRFISVSKHWQSLILNPRFAKSHLSRALSSQSNIHHKLIVDIILPCSIDCESLNLTIRDFPLQSESPYDISVLGSANGLLLVGCYNRIRATRYENLVLWNPSLRSVYSDLPGCILNSGFIRMIGFGYDSSSDDYKLVRLIADSWDHEPIDSLGYRVEIFSRRTNSWKNIPGVPFTNVYLNSVTVTNGTLVNGSLYWLVTDVDDEESNNLILAFDLTNETFRLIEIPSDLGLRPTCWRCLVEVKGRLGLSNVDKHSSEFVICVLNEDEKMNTSWSVFMRIPNDFKLFTRPVFFTKDDKVLLVLSTNMLLRTDRKLVVYDSANKLYLHSPALETIVWSNESMYVETLVSPNVDRSLEGE